MKTTRLVLIAVAAGVTLVIVAAVVVLFWVLRGSPVTLVEEVAAGSTVSVALNNSGISLRPSTDGEVHVTAKGSYFGQKPRIVAHTRNGVTTITGGCSNRWFTRCSLNVQVSVPPKLDLTVSGTNGRIDARDLTGRLELTTTNGVIETTGTGSDLDLRTTNGAIRVRDAGSKTALARTTNGSVTLEFRTPPRSVDARSTNGSVTVLLPDTGVRYYVDARTTNGSVNTDDVPSDRRARRTITVETTNGSVTVAPGERGRKDSR